MYYFCFLIWRGSVHNYRCDKIHMLRISPNGKCSSLHLLPHVTFVKSQQPKSSLLPNPSPKVQRWTLLDRWSHKVTPRKGVHSRMWRTSCHFCKARTWRRCGRVLHKLMILSLQGRFGEGNSIYSLVFVWPLCQAFINILSFLSRKI